LFKSTVDKNRLNAVIGLLQKSLSRAGSLFNFSTTRWQKVFSHIDPTATEKQFKIVPTCNTCQISSRSVYCVALCGKNPEFCRFWTSAFSAVAALDNNLRKFNTRGQRQTNGIKTVSVLQRLHGKIWCTNSDVQKHDEQTDRHTKKLNVLGRPGGGWNPSPTKLGMVIEDLDHVVAPPTLLRVRRIVSVLGGAEN